MATPAGRQHPPARYDRGPAVPFLGTLVTARPNMLVPMHQPYE